MQPPVRGKKKKKPVQPIIITTDPTFIPKVSERTIRKRQEAKEKKLKGSVYYSGLHLVGIVCLYIFLIICILIGIGGIVVCAIYLNDSSGTQGWKIAGIAIGGVTSIIGVILILLTICKQARNRPWRYRKEGELFNSDYGDMDNEGFDDSSTADGKTDFSASDGNRREIALSPIPAPLLAPLDLKNIDNDMIFCPGCNRSHPSSHQCMYSTRTANGFVVPFRSKTEGALHQDSIAIQTESDEKKSKKIKAHTVIDRTLKFSNTTETQTDVSANPRSNITESIILRRVPVPTAKVVVQQPTTKVMIVKVPNVAGQLVIQPKPGSTDEQLK